jgi:hypothetical protein
MYSYVKNQYLPDLTPESVPDEIALANGEFLLELLEIYLNNDFTDWHILDMFKPNNVVTAERKSTILGKFNTDENKQWLGRQFYLAIGMPPHGKFIDGYGSLFDDVPMFLNWLTNRGTMEQMLGPSPIMMAGGRRRSHTNKRRRKGRKTYRRS